MYRSVSLSTLLLFAIGCGEDEIVAKARQKKEEAASTSSKTSATAATTKEGGAGAAAGAAGAAGQSGKPEEPEPGKPEGSGDPNKPGEPGKEGEPVAGVPEEPPPGDPSVPPPGGSIGKPETGFTGPAVQLEGSVEFTNYKSGKVKVVAFDGEHKPGGGQPKIVAEMILDQPGPFSLKVPESAGNLYVEAAVDEDSDGRPGPTDPQGKGYPYPIEVGAENVSGLVVRLEHRAPPPNQQARSDRPKDDY